MNLFEQYGIKEVADVTIYEIQDDGTEVPYLYLDSLKVSTVEQTAEQAEARGGKGNPPLIIWDYGKEINITLEDALYSPKSMALMFGGGAKWVDTTEIEKVQRIAIAADATALPTEIVFYDQYNKKDVKVPAASVSFFGADGTVITSANVTTVTGQEIIAKWKQAVTGSKLTINADSFPGTYKLVGDTYARNRNTGKDENFQFVINRAKMSAEETLTLEAEGDPTTFNLNMRVLRPSGLPMMEFIQYKLGE